MSHYLTGQRRSDLYRMEVPYQYEVEVKVQVGEDKPSVSRKTVLRGEAFDAEYPEKEGCRIASVKIDKKEIDLEKYQSKYTLKSVQGAHTISIVYEKKLAMWKIILPVCVGVITFCQRALFLKSPADTADPKAQTGKRKNAAEQKDQMAQRQVEYRRNLLNFQKQFIKKELFLFASCYNKAGKDG